MAGGVGKGHELSSGSTDCFIRVLTGMCSDKQEAGANAWMALIATHANP